VLVAHCRHTAISRDGDPMIDAPTVIVLVNGRNGRSDGTTARLSISAGQAMFANAAELLH